MVSRVRTQDGAVAFWDWLFRALSTTSAPGGGSQPCKKLRLHERPAIAAVAAAPVLRAAAPCLGAPPLLPLLADFLLRQEHQPYISHISRDTWLMTRVFLQRFPSVESLESYDDRDGEFPCLFDRFVEEIRRSM